MLTRRQAIDRAAERGQNPHGAMVHGGNYNHGHGSIPPLPNRDHGHGKFMRREIDADPHIQKAHAWGMQANVVQAFINSLGLDRVRGFIRDVEGDSTIRCRSRVLYWRLQEAERAL